MTKDDVSRKLGQMLLQGYKMLADSCTKCNNVLMQDKKGLKICVNCQDTEENETVDAVPVPQKDSVDVNNASSSNSNGNLEACVAKSASIILAEKVLLGEIRMYSKLLDDEQNKNFAETLNGENLDKKLRLVRYIRECGETLKTITEIKL